MYAIHTVMYIGFLTHFLIRPVSCVHAPNSYTQTAIWQDWVLLPQTQQFQLHSEWSIPPSETPFMLTGSWAWHDDSNTPCGGEIHLTTSTQTHVQQPLYLLHFVWVYFLRKTKKTQKITFDLILTCDSMDFPFKLPSSIKCIWWSA